MVRCVAALILAGLTGLSGCSTVGAPGYTSPYFRPEPGVVYRYGEFCGPGIPAFLGDASLTREDKIERILATPPIDDLDRICKWHDLCYEIAGHDLFECDAIVPVAPYRQHFVDREGQSNHIFAQRCASISAEIVAAVGLLKSRPKDARGGDAAITATGRAMASVMAPLKLTSVPYGYADEGACFLNEAGLRRVNANHAERIVEAVMAVRCPGRKRMFSRCTEPVMAEVNRWLAEPALSQALTPPGRPR